MNNLKSKAGRRLAATTGTPRPPQRLITVTLLTPAARAQDSGHSALVHG